VRRLCLRAWGASQALRYACLGRGKNLPKMGKNKKHRERQWDRGGRKEMCPMGDLREKDCEAKCQVNLKGWDN
jgi:hypothetical protein